MSWVKNDDRMSRHRKIAPLTYQAFRLYYEARDWCSANGTDGRIAADDLPYCGTDKRHTQPRYAAELVARGLWHAAGDPECEHPADQCPRPGPDGWAVHDHLEFNPSKASVDVRNAARAEAGRRGGIRSGETRRSKAEANGEAVASKQTKHVATKPANPVPSRPVPSPGGSSSDRTSPPHDPGPEPPRRCPKHTPHIDGIDPGPCGACADARRAHDAWELARAEWLRTAPKCRRHRGQLAHNCAQCLGEQKGAA